MSTSKKENIKSLFSNTRSRMVIVFTAILLIFAIVIGFFKFRAAGGGGLGAESAVSSAPGGIQSIPGAIEQTAQYAKLQQEQNVNQATKAQQSGGSAIPTIIESRALGQGVGVVGSKSGVGFATLAREQQGGPQQSLWAQSLKDGNCSKNIVQKIVSEGGQLSDIKAGCSCAQMKDVGYSVKELDSVCDCKELRAAGFNARQLKESGFTATRLHNCGFSACEMREAGFSVQEMKDAGYSDGELKGAGFSEDDISKAGGLPAGMTPDQVRKAGCDVASLTKLRKQGVSAAAVRRINGCTLDQLKAAGYTAADLRGAGFSAADLKNAGFSAEDLKAAGFSAGDLADAGFSDNDLAKAGFSPGQIKAAHTELPPGLSPDDVKNSGCDVDELKREKEAGVSAALIKRYAHCSAQALRAAGFNDDDLANAGFNSQEIKDAAPLSDQDIKAAGCDPDKLKKLLAAGVSAKKIKELNGCNAQALKDAGFNVKSLMNAGFSNAELKAAGVTDKQIEDADKGPAALLVLGRTANCSVDFLKKAKAAGMKAATIKKSFGCSAKAMMAAGFSAKELKDAGFTAAELKNAGFSAADLNAAGFSAKELHDAGVGAGDLKKLGMDVKNLKDAGFSDEELTQAGFTLPKTAVAALEQPKAEEKKAAPKPPQTPIAAGASQLQAILAKQTQQQVEQKNQQKIQQRISEMQSAASSLVSDWKKVTTQTFTGGGEEKSGEGEAVGTSTAKAQQVVSEEEVVQNEVQKSVVKTGDVLFAVIDTSISSDEPGPILATIVSGKLKGAKLIGSFNLPANANKMIITFNTLSVPGAERTMSIQAVAIDPNTARTALSSRTNHHYLMRYGSLFASSFLQGFGNAIQTANTTVTIGGTGGGNDVTIASGIGQSTLENAVIGLATVGKAWGQTAQQNMNTPTTVIVYSGTAIGVLFTQDIVIS